MRALDHNAYVSEQPLRFVGIPVGARMGVIALGGGGVLLYSPIAPTDDLVAEVAKLGEVRFVLAPNRWHHLYAQAWQAHAPKAETWIARGLVKKRPDLAHAGTLDQREAPFDADVAHHRLRGAPAFDETVLLHKPSRTLFSCDLVHNVGAQSPFGQRVMMRLVGGFGGVKSNLIDRFSVRDRDAMKTSLETILAWDFDRLVMAHGSVCERHGKSALRDAWSWLLN